MVGRQLDERRERLVTDRLGASASRRERAAGPRCATSGGRPGIWYSSLRSSHVGSGTDASSPFVYGLPGRANSSTVGARSMILPAYITMTSVGRAGDDAEIVRDENDARAGLVLQLLDELEDLRLNRHVERGRRLVGDEQLRPARQRHRDHHALPHAAGELVRIAVGAPRARRECRPSRACCTACSCASSLRVSEMQLRHLHQLLRDAHERIQRRHRILKDHRDALAADRAHLAVGQLAGGPCRRTSPRRRRCGPAASG